MINNPLPDASLDQLFREARTHNGWLDTPVSDELLKEVYDLAKWGATSANSSPMRVLFLKSDASKERLYPTLAPQNVEKTRIAPVTAIIAWDMEFYDKLPQLFPHVDARSWFAGNEALALETARRNSSLQGAYLMLAARALGLDCGPMSGFNTEKLNAEFFPDGKWQVNFICNLGYGDETKLFPRSPRLEFDETAKIL